MDDDACGGAAAPGRERRMTAGRKREAVLRELSRQLEAALAAQAQDG